MRIFRIRSPDHTLNNMSKSSPGKYKTFIKDGKEYLNTRYDLLRLELLEKVSSVVALLILVMVGLVLISTVWVYISCILIVLMKDFFGSFIPAFLIMGGFSLLVLILVVLLKDKIILNPLIGRFSKILFDDFVDEEEEEDAGDQENDTKTE